ncbi:MAG: hypothetical protein ACUVTW_05990, partial [Thermogutta sp.]
MTCPALCCQWRRDAGLLCGLLFACLTIGIAVLAALSADMAADSPVAFPKQGALLAKYPPDQPSRDFKAPEPDYYLFSTPQR